MFIKGKKINIRNVKVADAKSIVENMEDKEVNKWFGGCLTLKEGEEFIKKTNKRKDETLLGIELPETGEIIGMVSLINIDYENKQVGILSWLGKKYWRQGFS